MGKKRCDSCENRILDTLRFCPHCGATQSDLGKNFSENQTLVTNKTVKFHLSSGLDENTGGKGSEKFIFASILIAIICLLFFLNFSSQHSVSKNFPYSRDRGETVGGRNASDRTQVIDDFKVTISEACPNPNFFSGECETGMGSEIGVTVQTDHVLIKSLRINNGNCKSLGEPFGKLPFPKNAVFGDHFEIMTYCTPILIEIYTDRGVYPYKTD